MPKKKGKEVSKQKPLTEEQIQYAKRRAIKKMESVFADWYIDDPVMLGAWCLLDKIIDPKQDTIGIDSRTSPVTIRYNPFFINSIGKEQLECVMASEGFKILLRHPTTRFAKPRPISNMASQITINQSIMNHMPGDKDFILNPEQFGMPNDKWYELYFQKLMDQLDDAMKNVQMIFGKPQDGKDGEGKDGKDGQQFKQYDGQGGKDNPIKDYLNPFGKSNQDWNPNDLFDADIKNMIDDKRSSTKDWGKFTGDAMGDIVAANSAKISYKDIIRRFGVSVMSSSLISSRMKVNRRHDLLFPGFRRKYKSKLIFAIDISGSMSDDDLREGFAVVNSCCKHCQMEYILFDTEIKQVEKSFKRARKNFKVQGRGGTDFNAICQYAEKHKKDGLIIYTDGYAPCPTKPKGTKVLWLMTTKEKQRASDCDWGMVATLDRFEDAH